MNQRGQVPTRSRGKYFRMDRRRRVSGAEVVRFPKNSEVERDNSGRKQKASFSAFLPAVLDCKM